MSVNKTSILGVLEDRFDRIAPIEEDSILQAESSPFGVTQAICFVDFSRRITDSDFNIEEYQERFLSRAFYSRNDASRWNLYLLLLCDRHSYKKLLATGKALEIERNELYGRKFVLPDEQLEELLNYVVGPAEVFDSPRPTSSISIWRDKLTVLGLPPFPESSPASKIVGDYIDGKPTPGTAKPLEKRSPIPPPQPIDQIAIRDFRPCLDDSEYQFGMVNLIVGENGVGKTSLLEAIEYWVCGRTRRSQTPSGNPDIRIRFRDDPNW